MRRTTANTFLIITALLLTSCSSGSNSNSSDGLGVYPKAVNAVDETAAIQTLRTIATAEGQLRASRGSYGDFNDLVQAGFLDQRFASTTPNLRSYRFSISASESGFAVNADPQSADSNPLQGRHFYLDSTDNVVHANLQQPATRNDPGI